MAGPKKFLNYKLQPISTSILKNSILTHIAKKLHAVNFCNIASSKKHLALKSFFNFFFDLSKTVPIIDLNFKFLVSMSRNVRFMDKTLQIFLKNLNILRLSFKTWENREYQKFWALCFVHKSYTFDIETQNWNVRSTTKPVLEK